MNWTHSRWGLLLTAAWALEFTAAWAAAADAPRPRHYQPYCPPGYQQTLPYPGSEAQMWQNLPPSARPQPLPGEQARPDAAGQPSQSGQQTQPDPSSTAQTPQQPSDTPTFNPPSASASSLASLGPGANTPMLGRNDQSNRLNLFDNMSAMPRSRAWFAFQYAHGFDTALRPTDELTSFLSSPSNPSLTLNEVLFAEEGITTDFFVADQAVYRVGMEYVIEEGFSFAVQGQYIGTLHESDPNDTWTNPQIMFKYVLACDRDSVLTATLGVTPDVGAQRGDINETTTRIYPGLLVYEGLTPRLFAQGGGQVGLPVDKDQVTHADWSLALGYWLYQAPACCDPCGRGTGRQGWHGITGIVPQVNVLGKHVLGDDRVVGPFGFQSSASGITTSTGFIVFPFPSGFVLYEEPRSVVDLTVGSQFLIGRSIELGVGYSIPLTERLVRHDESVTSPSQIVRLEELITTLTYVF